MIRERIDQHIEERIEAVLEPHIEQWLHRFFRSAEGEALITEVSADFLLSWLSPPSPDSKEISYFQRTLLEVIRQTASRDPEFRQQVIDVLNPHWQRPHQS